MNKWNFKKAAFMFGMTVFLSAGIKASSSAKTEELKIADIKFENSELTNQLKKADRNSDGYLSEKERTEVKDIKIDTPGSQKDLDLALEIFPKTSGLAWNSGNLTTLRLNGEIYGLSLSTKASSQVELTGNLDNLYDIAYFAEGTQKYAFDSNVSGYNGLKGYKSTLYIDGSQIQEIHLSNLSIERFQVGRNSNLENIIVENCNELELLYVTDSVVKKGSIRSCNELCEFLAYRSQFKKIGTDGLEFTSCSKLKNITFDTECTIDSLDIPNLANLKCLECRDCSLQELNVPKSTNLEHLLCDKNKLTNIDVSKLKNLSSLSCSYNKLTNLDISKNQNLTSLDCSGNKLKKLSISKNKKLKNLECVNTQLKQLVLKNNKQLFNLNCSNNPLKNLSLRYNKKLTSLTCTHTIKKFILKV